MEQPSGPGQRPTRPRTVNIAFILYLVNSALGILGAVILMATMDSLIVAEARAAGLDSEAESVLETFRAAMMITAVIALIFSAVFLLFVFMMRNGRNWARILLTVLSGLALLSTIGSLGDTGSNGLLVGQTMLSIALPIGAIVAMYLPESNRYFKSN
ncbi:hypothetical protein UA75_02355 [Actinoalloteichus sp. GBA129-24]|uniref:Uncharacterized protein n=2 Tax=Pseudonocardiaceae TaxID=2070 RepID=A0AAC9L9K2_9PSEU|nr:hypothetical protein UA74_02350 [Actinoalloteichus fjordicus]APU18510.1 hypothetical protein UA75_02355 [Actinoalloteichus sp. GBA129-24]